MSLDIGILDQDNSSVEEYIIGDSIDKSIKAIDIYNMLLLRNS